MTNIFFDLDGTIINSQRRLYDLFCELCPDAALSYEAYWNIKRKRISQKELLKTYFGYSENKIKGFKKNWLEKVEEEHRLKADFLVEEVKDLLEKLSEKFDLYLVTNRQSKDLTLKQLENLSIKKFFKKIFITQQKNSKAHSIDIPIKKDDFFITDTGEDIQIASNLGIKTIAVSWGILNRNILEEYFPYIIVDEVKEIENYFL